jgi:hypothetical protein
MMENWMIYLSCFLICFVLPGLVGLFMRNGYMPAIVLAVIAYVFTHSEFSWFPKLHEIMSEVWRRYSLDHDFQTWMDVFTLLPWFIFLIIFCCFVEVRLSKEREKW